MKTSSQLLCVFLCAISFLSTSQTVEKIKFKRDKSLIYFFQKGLKSDTLHANTENLFYLVVPDTLKRSLSIQVENGQLFFTANDSLVKFVHLPGFKYESFYITEEKSSGRNVTTKKQEFKTMVDGVSVLPHNKISISLINKATGGLMLENVFWFTK